MLLEVDAFEVSGALLIGSCLSHYSYSASQWKDAGRQVCMKAAPCALTRKMGVQCHKVGKFALVPLTPPLS